jgi:uncharacterized protein YcbX/ferredoxin-NADP reductase
MYLAAIYEHPLKSGRGNRVDSAQVQPEGLLHDRRFLAHTVDGTFVSGRSHPRLVRVRSDFNGHRLVLSTPGQDDLVVTPSNASASSVAVWKDRFAAWDQGDTAARWLSTVLGDTVRLSWLGASQRVLRWDHDQRVTFADAAPLLGVSTASVDDLSRRVGEALSVRRFRPNLVFSGTEPFEEDRWKRFRVGEVEFLGLDGCSRCEFTTLDPDTGERHSQSEPVATLEAYRKIDTGIYFGLNLLPVSVGTVQVGDAVTVLETRTPLVFGWTSGATDPGQAVPGEPGELDDGETALVCTAVREEAPGVKTFTLARPDGMKTAWKAGQYVTLRLEPELRRSYSLASAPGASELQITVKELEGGKGSTWLHEQLKPGASVVAEGIGGHFTLEDHPWNSVLFLGAGSGVTPLMAMLRDIAERGLDVAVAFHQCARRREDLLFVRELETLQTQLGSRLTLGWRVTSEQGHLTHNDLVRFCPDLRDRRAFVCGPAGYRSTVRGLLDGAGLKVDRRYHEELFGEAALEVPEDAEAGEVTFSTSAKRVESDGRSTVLQLAERAGIDVNSSCRSGDCGTCRVRNAAGEWLLACHTFPRGSQAYLL